MVLGPTIDHRQFSFKARRSGYNAGTMRWNYRPSGQFSFLSKILLLVPSGSKDTVGQTFPLWDCGKLHQQSSRGWWRETLQGEHLLPTAMQKNYFPKKHGFFLRLSAIGEMSERAMLESARNNDVFPISGHSHCRNNSGSFSPKAYWPHLQGSQRIPAASAMRISSLIPAEKDNTAKDIVNYWIIFRMVLQTQLVDVWLWAHYYRNHNVTKVTWPSTPANHWKAHKQQCSKGETDMQPRKPA